VGREENQKGGARCTSSLGTIALPPVLSSTLAAEICPPAIDRTFTSRNALSSNPSLPQVCCALTGAGSVFGIILCAETVGQRRESEPGLDDKGHRHLGRFIVAVEFPGLDHGCRRETGQRAREDQPPPMHTRLRVRTHSAALLPACNPTTRPPGRVLFPCFSGKPFSHSFDSFQMSKEWPHAKGRKVHANTIDIQNAPATALRETAFVCRYKVCPTPRFELLSTNPSWCRKKILKI